MISSKKGIIRFVNSISFQVPVSKVVQKLSRFKNRLTLKSVFQKNGINGFVEGVRKPCSG